MNDQKFEIYNEPNVHFNGEIKAGCLILTSSVFGDDYDSEMIYEFSRADTGKLFSILTLEDFIDFCKENHLRGLDEFLEKNDIHPETHVF